MSRETLRSVPPLEGFKNRLDTYLSGNSLCEIDLVTDLALQLKDRLDDMLRSLSQPYSLSSCKIRQNEVRAASEEKGRRLWEKQLLAWKDGA